MAAYTPTNGPRGTDSAVRYSFCSVRCGHFRRLDVSRRAKRTLLKAQNNAILTEIKKHIL